METDNRLQLRTSEISYLLSWLHRKEYSNTLHTHYKALQEYMYMAICIYTVYALLIQLLLAA